MTPLERAARAIRDNVHESSAVANHMHEEATKRAVRAVLTAIREPSEAVLTAMRDTVPVDGYEWEYLDEQAVEHWQAMIDALLTEEG